jgi:hypothetical protein
MMCTRIISPVVHGDITDVERTCTQIKGKRNLVVAKVFSERMKRTVLSQFRGDKGPIT